MRLAVGTGLRSPCRASCGRSRPLVCTRMPPGRLIIAWRAKKRVEWLALSRLRYLTNWTNSRVRSTHLLHTKSPFSRFFWAPTPKKREHSRERTWTADGPSTNFARFGVRERVKNTIINRVRSIPGADRGGLERKGKDAHGTRFEIFFGGYGYVTTQDGTSRSESRGLRRLEIERSAHGHCSAPPHPCRALG